MNKKPTPEQKRNEFRKRWYGEAVLTVLSFFYGAAVSVRGFLYRSGFFKSKKLPVPVICFGNLSAGGTGKTSAVIAAAVMLSEAGFHPAVILRGYKRKAPAKRLTILAADSSFDRAEAGDEACLIYQTLGRNCAGVFVCADRFAAGEAAVKHSADLILMDDGFQHLSVGRDADIVLVNAADPFTGDRLLPYGNLREKPSGLKRASAVILSHCEQASEEEIAALKKAVSEINPSVPVLTSLHEMKCFVRPGEPGSLPLSCMAGRRAVALSAIGDPVSFEKSLGVLGVNLEQRWRYPDHHFFTRTELNSLKNAKGGLPVITTAKDFERFPEDWMKFIGEELYILAVSMTFRENGAGALLDLIKSRTK